MKTPDNLDLVYDVFRKNYELVPLEVFVDDPYQTLISTLMSSRTNDDTTLVAAKKLFKKAKNIETLNTITEKEIARTIYPVGFYKTKAKNIKKLTQMILDEFNGEIPRTREELVKLPGVGRKTANLTLNRAFGIPAIAVDTHLHKIANLLGWVDTTTPEKTEIVLMEIIPEDYWPEMNKLFVSIGRQYKSKRLVEEFLRKNDLIS